MSIVNEEGLDVKKKHIVIANDGFYHSIISSLFTMGP